MLTLVHQHEICHRGCQEAPRENNDRNGDQEPHLTVDAIGEICCERKTTIPWHHAVVPAVQAGTTSAAREIGESPGT